MNPWDPQSKRQYGIDGVYCALNAGNAIGCQAHGVCYAIDQQGGKGNCGYAENVMMTLCSDSHGTPHALCYAIERNPQDGRLTMNDTGIVQTLKATMGHWTGNVPLVYAIEGNIVDRVSNKNGKGYCEEVSPTLNTQDRHAVCFQLCGNRDDPSVSVSDTAYCIPANPMSDRGQAVCYRK